MGWRALAGSPASQLVECLSRSSCVNRRRSIRPVWTMRRCRRSSWSCRRKRTVWSSAPERLGGMGRVGGVGPGRRVQWGCVAGRAGERGTCGDERVPPRCPPSAAHGGNCRRSRRRAVGAGQGPAARPRGERPDQGGVHPATEQLLVDTIAGLPVDDAAQVVRFWQRSADENGTDPRDRDANALWLSQSFDGRWHLKGNLDVESGSVVYDVLSGVVEQARRVRREQGEDLTGMGPRLRARWSGRHRSAMHGSRGLQSVGATVGDGSSPARSSSGPARACANWPGVAQSRP